MKYFILEQGKGYDRNPDIKEWYGKIDLHTLRLKAIDSKQPFMFRVSATENTFYPDIMMFPVFMVSESVREVIAIYGKQVLFKEVFLLDPERNEGHTYYIPFLPVVDCLECREGIKGKQTREYMLGEEKLRNWNIVEADIQGRQCIIVSLDFAESVLRRGLTGIGLKEIDFKVGRN